MDLKLPRRGLYRLFETLLDTHGPQHWWPGNSPFEIMVGAVLTQNTAWTNVERAIANLLANDALSATRILAVDESDLANWLRPSGYFNIKARRLRAFCAWYQEAGGYAALRIRATDDLRRSLLAINGVGPETADDILLYAFERPVFVIDAYTHRLFSRLGLIAGDESYEALRAAFETALDSNVALFNEYHALIVTQAKHICRVRPDCARCVLRRRCVSEKKGLEAGRVAAAGVSRRR